MRETDQFAATWRWKRLTHSISAKLIGSLLAVMVVIFALLGYLNIRLHRQHLEAATLASAERVSDVIKRSTTYYMLRNDREGLYHAIQTMADEPGMVKVRILDPGRPGQLLHRSNGSQPRSRQDGRGLLWLPHPIAAAGAPESPRPLSHLSQWRRATSAGNYHSHRKSTQLLQRRMPRASRRASRFWACSTQIFRWRKRMSNLQVSSARMLYYTAGAMLIVAVLSWLFVWREVGKPIKALEEGHGTSFPGRTRLPDRSAIP